MISAETILYPVGHHACGKTELSSYLADEHGFQIVETGAMVREQYANRPTKMSGMNIGQFVAAIEITEPDYFIDLTVNQIRSSSSGVIVNGMRSPDHLDKLQTRLVNHRQLICWIESPREELKVRWERREGRLLCDEEFDELLRFDSNLGLDQLRERADVTICNDGSVEQMQTSAVRLFRQLGAISLT